MSDHVAANEEDDWDDEAADEDGDEGRDDDGWVDVASGAEIAERRPFGARVGGEPVVVTRIDGQLRAVGGVCTHAGVLLEDGWITGTTVHCPAHEAGFDLVSGAATCPPACGAVPVHPVCERPTPDGTRVFVNRIPLRNMPEALSNRPR